MIKQSNGHSATTSRQREVRDRSSTIVVALPNPQKERKPLPGLSKFTIESPVRFPQWVPPYHRGVRRVSEQYRFGIVAVLYGDQAAQTARRMTLRLHEALCENALKNGI